MSIREALLPRFDRQRAQIPFWESAKSGLTDADHGHSFNISLG